MKKCFTLIELLVVIAIIAILASMLLPALNQARDKAQAVKCTGLFKQYATAWQMYSDNYRGVYPPNTLKTSAGSTRCLATLEVIDLLNVKVWDRSWGTNSWSRNMVCPKSTAAQNSDSTPAGMVQVFRVLGVAWQGGELMPGETSDTTSNTKRFFKASKIKKPSSKISLIDHRGDSTPAVWNANINASNNYYKVGEVTSAADDGYRLVAYRHKTTAGTSFFDGHAEQKSYNKLYDGIAGSPISDQWFPYGNYVGTMWWP